MINACHSEGYLTGKMKVASLQAMAKFIKIPLTQILVAGDDLSAGNWGNCGRQLRKEVRESLFWLDAEECLES